MGEKEELPGLGEEGAGSKVFRLDGSSFFVEVQNPVTCHKR